MAFGDDIIIRMGLDNRPFSKGLRKSTAMAQKFGGVLRSLGGVLAAGTFVRLGKSLLDFADNLETSATTIGLTTTELQELRIAAEQVGVANRTTSLALQRFSRRLAEARQGGGELKDTLDKYNISLRNGDGSSRVMTDVLGDLAEAIKNTVDPTEQLRIAFKAFDSEGAQLVGLLKDGRDGLAEFRDQASAGVIPDAELEKLNRFNNLIKQGTNEARAFATKAIGKIVERTREFGAFLGGFSIAGPQGGVNAVNRLRQQEKEATEKEQMAQAKRRENAQRLRDIEAEQNKIQERKTTELEKQEELQERMLELNKEGSRIQQDQATQEARLKRAKEDRAKFTLQELATSNIRFTGRLGQEQIAAREAFAREQLGERARRLGFGDLAKAQFERADQIRNSLTNLTQAERFPFRTMEQGIAESAKALQSLDRKAQQEGLRVIPSNG